MHHWGGRRGGRGKVVGLRTNLICTKYMYIHTRRTKYEFQPRGGVEGVWSLYFLIFCGRGVIFALLLKVHNVCLLVLPFFFFSSLQVYCSYMNSPFFLLFFGVRKKNSKEIKKKKRKKREKQIHLGTTQLIWKELVITQTPPPGAVSQKPALR